VRNLLEAFRLARDRAPEARLRFAGLATIPEYEAAVHETVRRLGLEDAVEFLGALPPARLAAEYARCVFLALVSRQETLPVAIQEAMAVGRPVVASPVGGVPHLVREGENGFLVPWGDPERLATRFVELLRDRELRDRLGAAARRLAEEKFRLESVCRRTMDVYRDVVARHAAEARLEEVSP
jgi:glycosyltransferase involved in cell wall biosynthesis